MSIYRDDTPAENYTISGYLCVYALSDKTEDCYCDAALLVDLTENFGVGNEPSKEWCDANLDWFDGTISKEFIIDF